MDDGDNGEGKHQPDQRPWPDPERQHRAERDGAPTEEKVSNAGVVAGRT
jgi:hypothetical protein